LNVFSGFFQSHVITSGWIHRLRKAEGVHPALWRGEGRCRMYVFIEWILNAENDDRSNAWRILVVWPRNMITGCPTRTVASPEWAIRGNP
jgi:hypothetical protein